MEVRARAAQRLVQFSSCRSTSVFFVNSGAEANENALKMAFAHDRAARTSPPSSSSFHGRTAAAGAVTWGARRSGTAFRARRST